MDQHDRDELARLAGIDESRAASMPDERLITEAAQSLERSYQEYSETDHASYQLPNVSLDTAKELYRELSDYEMSRGAMSGGFAVDLGGDDWVSGEFWDDADDSLDSFDDVVDRYGLSGSGAGYTAVFVYPTR
jgi:hypothetical protein